MNSPYKFTIIALVYISIGCGISKSDDSIPSTELMEVSVTGTRSWISMDGTLNFIPNKKEKRLSNSPGSLIDSMRIPTLKGNGENIETSTGESVVIFINGKRAENIDLAVFWPNDVKTVQFLTHPQDPCFEGESYVVNFIMRQYSAGGVCRTSGTQNIPNGGVYSSSAKVIYERMTYGAMVQGIYSRDHSGITTGETLYKDLYYKEEYFDKIVQTEDSRTHDRHDIINCALNARYNGRDFTATHTLSLAWIRDPGSGMSSTDVWTDNLFISDRSTSENRSRSLSPQIAGTYYKRFSDKWHLSLRWDYMHSHNRMHSISRTGETPAIENSNEENINTMKIVAAPTLLLSRKIYLQMSLSTRFDWFSTHYSGSANLTQRQHRNQSSGAVTLGWNPHDKLRMYLQPGIGLMRWSIGDIDEHTLYPTATAGLTWTPSRKISVHGSLHFASTVPTASESNPVMIQSSELIWTEGNPFLKSRTDWDACVNTSYIVSDNLSFMLGLNYDRSENMVLPIYEALSSDLGGLLMRNINSVPAEGVRVLLPINWTCPGGNLSFEATPRWRYSHIMGGPYKCHLNHVSFSAGADYSMGNCRFGISYEGLDKGIGLGGMERTWTGDRWNFDFTYGTENLFVNVGLENIFHEKARSRREYSSTFLMSSQTILETGRRLKVTLTYTFGFGRKTDRNIDISGPETVESSVLNRK